MVRQILCSTNHAIHPRFGLANLSPFLLHFTHQKYQPYCKIIMDDKFGLPTNADRILSQAYQRSLEIMLLGDQEANSLKKKLIALEKSKIDEEFHAKAKRQLVLRKIAKSESINSHRMRKISKKYQLCQKIFFSIELELQQLTNNPEKQDAYKVFLITSIADGLVRLFEDKVEIRCLEKDKALFEELIPLSLSSYKQYMQNEVGIQFDVDLSIAKNMTLQQRNLSEYKPLQKSQEDQKAIGGVILADQSGNITFKATFDSRLNILKEICLPEIRFQVWGGKPTQNL